MQWLQIDIHFVSSSRVGMEDVNLWVLLVTFTAPAFAQAFKMSSVFIAFFRLPVGAEVKATAPSSILVLVIWQAGVTVAFVWKDKNIIKILKHN